MLYTFGPIGLLFNAMNNQPTLVMNLSMAFTNRLKQLGLSRREFAVRSGLSRQTLHHIEVECRTALAASTFKALDDGLRWAPGTAAALAAGNDAVLTTHDPQSAEQRADALRWVVVKRLQSMSLEELETMVYQWADDERQVS